MKKKMIAALVLLIIVAVLASIMLINFEGEIPSEKKESELGSLKPGVPQSSSSEDNNEEEVSEPVENPVKEPLGGIEGGGGGSSGGESINPESLVSEPLPTDLYTAPCGTYFSRYDVCAGSCPNGECTIEGRSCYCKLG